MSSVAQSEDHLLELYQCHCLVTWVTHSEVNVVQLPVLKFNSVLGAQNNNEILKG